jgi:hypothetical protein
MAINDGKKGDDGEDALMLVITSSQGNYFKNNKGTTVLTARLFRGTEEIDILPPYDYMYTWKDGETSEILKTGKTLSVTAADVSFSRTYICDISKGGN